MSEALDVMLRCRVMVILGWLFEFYTPADALRWLVSSQSLLDGDIPADILDTRDGFEKVRAVIESSKMACISNNTQVIP